MKASTSALLSVVMVSLTVVSAWAADRTWDGGAGDSNWSSTANWDGDATAPAAGDALLFGGDVRVDPYNDFAAGTLFGRLVFPAGAGAFTLSGAALSLGGNITNASASLQTINLGLAIQQSTTVDASGGSLAVGGAVSGNYNLVKTGANTLTLRGANTYTNGTRVSAGTLVVAAGGSVSHFGASLAAGVTGGAKGLVKIESGAAVTARWLQAGVSANGAVGAVHNQGSLTLAGAASVDNFALGHVGANGYGYYRHDTAVPLTAAEVGVAANGGGNGALDLIQGAITNTSYLIGNRATTTQYGQLNVLGGQFVLPNSAANVGMHWNSTTAGQNVWTVSGGSLLSLGSATEIDLLKAPTATTGATGILNINAGGLVQVAKIKATQTAGLALVNANGGTLKAGAAGATLLGGSALDGVYLYAGGLTVDTDGKDVAVSQALLAPVGSGVASVPVSISGTGYIGRPVVYLTGGGGVGATAMASYDPDSQQVTGVTVTCPGSGYTSAPTVTVLGGGGSGLSLGAATLAANSPGGLVKTGAGTLALSGANTYSGPTAVSAGRLTTTTSSAGGGAYSVADGATLRVIANPGETLAASSLTLGSGGDATLELGSVSSTTVPVVTVSGSVTAGGAATLAVLAGNFVAGNSYPLIKYGALAGAGAFALGPLQRGLTGALRTNVAERVIYLDVTAAEALVWNGNVSALWSVAGDANWTNASAAGGLQYQESPAADAVRFDDTETGGRTSVTLNTVVSPGGVSFANETKTYTLSGAGGLSGGTGLSKSGAGAVTLATTNTYGGPTLIAAGTLQVGAGGTAGTLGTGPVINDGVLAYNRTDGQVWSQPISGSGSLSKQGAGTLTLPGANSYAGGTTIGGGVLQANHALALGAGPLAISGGLRLSVSEATLTNSLVFTSGPGATGRGAFEASAGTATLSGPLTLNAGPVFGGHFASINGSTLVVSGPITSAAVPVSFREGTGVFSGGGSYTSLLVSSTVRIGANNGVCTGAVLTVASSKDNTLFDLYGFNQELAGLRKGGNWGSVTNSQSALTSALTLRIGEGQTLVYPNSVRGAINVFKRGPGQQTLSGQNLIRLLAVGQGTLDVAASGATSSSQGGTALTVGGGDADNATLAISGGALSVTAAGSMTVIGDAGMPKGRVVQTGGSFTSQGPIRMATNTNGAWAVYSLTNGAVALNNTADSYLQVGRNGVAAFEQRGGSVTIQRGRTGENEGALLVGQEGGSVGTYTLDGGTLTVTNVGAGVMIGRYGTGTLTLTNGAAANINALVLSMYATGTGTVNLAGGELRINVARRSWAGANTLAFFNWSGGTLRPYSRDALVSNTLALTLCGPGATASSLDAFGVPRTLTLAGPLHEVGGSYGFTKTGAGTLALTGTNSTFSGTTVVSNGTLLANNAAGSATGSGAVTVCAGATLGGVGRAAGAVTVAAGGVLAPGTNAAPSVLTVGSLTVAAGATNAVDCVYATGASDRVVVEGELAIQGPATVALSFSGARPPFQVTVATFGSLTGAAYLPSWTVAGVDPAEFKTRVVAQGSSLVVVAERTGCVLLLR
jgi:autotransporter-associated beta strand protein